LGLVVHSGEQTRGVPEQFGSDPEASKASTPYEAVTKTVPSATASDRVPYTGAVHNAVQVVGAAEQSVAPVASKAESSEDEAA
jgi:hypothetical protein